MCGCGKRVFRSERDAQKGLGRTRAKRTRKADKRGTRRGLVVEKRYYPCPRQDDIFHLTHINHSEFDAA